MTGKVYGHPETCGHVVTATQSGYLYSVAMTLCGSPEAPSWCRGVTYREYSIRSSPSASRDKIVGTSAVTVVVDNLKAETWVSTTLPGETLGLHWVQIYVSGRNGQIGSIVAIDGASGQTRWTYGSAILTPKWSDGGPVVTFSATKTFVFVTGDDGSNGGFIQALEDTMVAAVPVWRLEYCGTAFQSSHGNTAPSNSIPSHSKCKQFSQLVASSTDVGATLYATCKDGYVYAIATTGAGAGTILWRYKPPSGADPTKYIAPSLSPDGQTLYYVRDNVATNTYSSPAVTHTSTIVVAINAADGVPLWLTPDIHTESPCTDPGFACDPNNTPVYTPDVIIRPATVSPSGDRLYVVLDAAGTLREISLKAMDAASSCAEKAAAKCGVGQGYTPGTSTTADDASCAACAAGSWNNADDTTGCAAKTVLKCVPGQEYTEGTATANDAACTNCAAGEYSDTDDTSACKPKTIQKCTSGEGYIEGALDTDSSSCNACTGAKFSNADDANDCQNHGNPNCPIGQGLAAGTASVDTSCAPCASGKYSTNTDSSACTDNTCPGGTWLSSAANQDQVCTPTCVAGKYKSGGCQDCKPGQYSTSTDSSTCSGIACATGKYGPAASVFALYATCGDCGVGSYADQVGQTVCKPHSTAKCGSGQGYTAGSLTADNAVCSGCVAGEYNSADDSTKCVAKSVLKCAQGKEYTEGTTAADDSACTNCAAGSWNNADDTTACAAKTVLKCAQGNGYTEGTTAANDASCAPCSAGSWNNADDTTACAAKTVLKCVQGQGYTEGTTTANDASCAPCSAGSWNNADDTTVCAVKTVLKCAKGTGFDEGTTTANDASCTTCSAGSWNNAYDTSGCAVKTVLKCAQGQGYTEGTTTANDASCALCAAGSWNNADDKTGCENCALGMYQTKMGQTSCVQNTCAAGTRSAGTTSEVQRCETCLAGQYSSANGATTCDACGRGRYQTNTGQLACLPAICEAFTSKLVASLAAKGIETTCGASAKPFGATCSLQCSTGYALKTKGDLTTASCEVTDPSKLPSWSLTDLACAEDSCPPWDAVEVQRTTGALHIDLASLSSSSLSSSAIKSTDKFVIPGVIVPMVCLKGYNASGGFLCERGAWKLNDALCTPSKCMTGTTSTFGVAGLELGLGAPGPDGAASGSTADAKCKCNAYPLPQGYEAKGAVRCIRGEWLVGSALCAPKLCTAKTTTSLGVYGLVIGLGQSAGGGTPSGETVRAACRTGFVASGMVRCERGMWVAGSARCVESGCGVTSTDLGVDGLLAGLGGTAGTATAGTTVRAKCDTGFEAIGELKCTATGEWDASSASCGEAPCGTAGDSAVRSGPGGIEGLLAVGGWGVGTASGSSIPTQCSNGYQALGVVTCRRGSWETDKASCVQDNMCSRPILGSAFDAAQCMDNGSPGISSCLISCASGYVSDAGGRTGVTAKCASSGKYEWTESLVCKAATCAAPDKSKLAPGVITNCPAGGSLGREIDEASIKAGLGGSSVGKKGTGTGATSCSFSCKEGFVVVGNGEATCVSVEGGGSGGSGAKGVAAAYSGYKMECDPLLCEPPESMPGASSALTSDCPTTGGAIGSFCQVRCKPGYVESPYFCTNTVLPVLTIGLPLTLFVALYKIYLFLPSTTRIHTHIHTLTHTSYKAVGSSDTTRCVYASSTGIADTTDNTRVQYEGHALSCVVQLPEAVPSLVSVKFVSGGAAVQVDIATASVASTNAISGGGGSLTFPCDSVLSVVGGNGASWNSGDKESADGTEGTGDDCTWQSLTSIMVHVRRREESPRETVLSCSSMCACMQCFKSCSVFDNRVDEHHNTTRH